MVIGARAHAPASGAASTGSSWKEGVRARVAARRHWFPRPAAIAIGNQGAELVRGWGGAAIVICSQGGR